MAKQKKAIQEKNGVVIAVTAGLCAAITLSRFVASFFPEKRLWGLSHLGYFPMPVRIGLTLAALAILAPWVNRGVRTFLKRLVLWIEEHWLRIPWKIGYAVLGVVAWFSFYLLRQRTYFLGDGRLLLLNLEMGRPRGGTTEPLGDLIPFWLYRLLSHLHLTPTNSYVILSCSAGVIFLLLALTWGKTIDTKGLLGRWVGFGVLITMGIVQQFFGYVENYSLLFAVQLAYFIVGLRVLEGRIPLFYPTLLLGVLISLHLTGLMLIPSWILLWVETQKTWSRSKKLGIFALGMLGTLLLIGVAIQRVGTPGHLNRYALPFSDGLSEAPRYTLLSGAHLADLINLFSLAAPIGLPLFFLTFWFHTALKNEGPKVWFLLLAGSAQLYFLFLFNPMLGAGRDWDLLSATGTIAITLLLTLAIIRAPFAGRGYLSLVLVWTGFFSTATFVTLNASEKASVRRAENLALLDPLRDRGVSVGNVIEYYQERHRDQEEHQFDERALDRVESILEENPENAIAHLLRGSLLLSYKGNVAEAQKEALIALEKEPDLSLAWDVLATTYLAQRQPARAISCYEHRLTLNPDYAFAWDQLAMLYNMTGQLDQEIRCLEKLTLLTPDKIRVWGSLGLALEAKKDYSGAESAFRRAIRLKTREPMLHSDLGRNLLFQGKWAEAEEECRAAIRLDPKLAEAYGNLGAALVQMGRYAEAESILREGLTIAPDLPKLHINLCLALQRQGRNEEAEAEHEIYLKMEKEGKK